MHHLFRQIPFAFLILSLSIATSAIAAPAPKNPPQGWPSFRGPSCNGHTRGANDKTPVDIPVHWSETENIRWKTAIPQDGWSTPVVLEGRIWLTWATPDGHDFHVVSIDAETGKILLDQKLFHSDNPEPLGNEVNCYASPTASIEPGRVYVHFGSYGTACLDAATGKPLWKRDDLPCRHYRGPGSSTTLYKNLLILTFDGADVQYLVALDKTTGKTVWKTDRTAQWQDLDEQGKVKREGDFRKGFTTPLVLEFDRRAQLISPCSWTTFSYDPNTGKELWKVRGPGYSPAVCPVFSNGLVFTTTGRGKLELHAIRPDGQGDVTDTHVAWKLEGAAVPTEPSPIAVDDLLYLISNNGQVTCLESATGAEVWNKRIGGNYLASPTIADGLLYFFSTTGKTTVIKAGRACEIIATNDLDAGFMASPAVVGKALYLRTKTHLYRIEDAKKK